MASQWLTSSFPHSCLVFGLLLQNACKCMALLPVLDSLSQQSRQHGGQGDSLSSSPLNTPRWPRSQRSLCTLEQGRVKHHFTPTLDQISIRDSYCYQTALTDSSQVNSTGSKSGRIRECAENELCVASEIVHRRYIVRAGVVEKPTVTKCKCARVKPPCRRHVNWHVFFPGSEFERKIDVGRCGGRCNSNTTTCEPLRNTTITIKGPNGDRCVSVVTSCGCATECHRFSYNETFVQLKTDEDGKNFTAPLTIDVGLCVGACKRASRKACEEKLGGLGILCRNTFRKSFTPGEDDGIPRYCRPDNNSFYETFTNVKGETQRVPVIKNCACKTG